MPKSRTRRLMLVLVVLLFLDLLFIGLHLGYELADSGWLSADWLLRPMYSLEEEGSYGNLYQHAKQLAIVLLLLVTFLRSRKVVYGLWTVVFAYVLLDDVLLLHEQVGRFLTALFELPMLDVLGGIVPREYAQFLFLALVGVVLLLPLFVVFRTSARRERLASLYYMIGIFLLFVFAGFLDQLDRTAVSYSITGLTSLLLSIEESGELLVFTPLVVYTLYLAMELRPPPPPIQISPGTHLDRLLGKAKKQRRKS